MEIKQFLPALGISRRSEDRIGDRRREKLVLGLGRKSGEGGIETPGKAMDLGNIDT
jgi:hypothetical protein